MIKNLQKSQQRTLIKNHKVTLFKNLLFINSNIPNSSQKFRWKCQTHFVNEIKNYFETFFKLFIFYDFILFNSSKLLKRTKISSENYI